MIPVIDKNSSNRIVEMQSAIDSHGVFAMESVLDAAEIEYYKEALFDVEKKMMADIGESKFLQARINGDNALRLMMKYNSAFYKMLEIPLLIETVHHLLSDMAILKFQNGFIQRSPADFADKSMSQRQFHMNTRQFHGDVMTSLDIGFFFDDDVSELTPHFEVCPGTHRKGNINKETLKQVEEAALFPKGTMFVFDSTLWHRETENLSDNDSVTCFCQFTMPYIKQHIDFVRALGVDVVKTQSKNTKRFLGWDSRVPANLEEFYLPSEQRLYKAGQP